MTLKNQDKARRIIELLQDSEVNQEEDKEPGRRQYDNSTGKLVAYGVGGGSVIGILTSLFMFMNSAPWASKGDVATLTQNVQRLEDQIKAHVDGPGHAAPNAEISLLKSQLSTINEKLSEMRIDLKDIKDRRVVK